MDFVIFNYCLIFINFVTDFVICDDERALSRVLPLFAGVDAASVDSPIHATCCRWFPGLVTLIAGRRLSDFRPRRRRWHGRVDRGGRRLAKQGEKSAARSKRWPWFATSPVVRFAARSVDRIRSRCWESGGKRCGGRPVRLSHASDAPTWRARWRRRALSARGAPPWWRCPWMPTACHPSDRCSPWPLRPVDAGD